MVSPSLNFSLNSIKYFMTFMILHHVAMYKNEGDMIFQKFGVPMSKFGGGCRGLGS